MLVALLAIILTLILVVGIHEGGHALVARFFHVKIKKISIGFGKPLLQWQSKSGCDWVWAMWPLGGYVQLLNTRITPVDPKEYPVCFDKKPVWIRILILLAGPLANLITAWLALVLVFYIGINYKLPQIQSVQANSAAAQAGVLVGDQFIAIGGYPTPSWQEVGMELVSLWGKKDVKVTLKQTNQQLKDISLDLSQIKFTGREKSLLASMGISPNLSAPNGVMRSSSFLEATQQASTTIVHMVKFFMMILKQLFSGVIPFAILLGPIGLFAASVASLKQGVVVFIFFIASFSLAVAVVNLFPVPGLDGGSILYSIIEKIRGKPMSVALEVLIYQLMFIAFCLLLVHLVTNDLTRMFQ
ncbi:M50 family metallopeptidase [Legionella maioricensis]|uniref:Site-2 protease family protein n=1 Tax=Legionella maioricensis TaxID=2896528 RepID=A0A9X2D2Y9_9GAMM|nr:site-2 protease family protein [Legionella maioricensis]MCL9685498.1 site-2 protease family protein [Legionella maioricensis]MCL9688794.1 site-2 protease family protein [Legionella maioricensis]